MVAGVRALPDSSLIDRLVRGRAWIPVLGVMLAGIVFMQVEILKLGSSMGRWIERSSTLSARNEQLRVTVAGLADDQRIESLAAGMGMVMPPASALGFLTVHGSSASAGVGHIHAPDAAQFLASLPSTNPTTASATSGVQPAAGTLASSPVSPNTSSTSPASTATTAQAGSQTVLAASTSAPATQGGASQSTAGTAQAQSPASPTSSGTAVSGGGAAIAPAGPSSQSSGH